MVNKVQQKRKENITASKSNVRQYNNFSQHKLAFGKNCKWKRNQK